MGGCTVGIIRVPKKKKMVQFTLTLIIPRRVPKSLKTQALIRPDRKFCIYSIIQLSTSCSVNLLLSCNLQIYKTSPFKSHPT